jgi:Deoxyhypusine synthase
MHCGTAGGVEEDLIKCMGKTYVGAFQLGGKELRLKGQNRIGNMLVPNNNYCAFEEFINPVLSEMLAQQNENGTSWTPSKMIRRFGERINDEDSVYYWCELQSLVLRHLQTHCRFAVSFAWRARGICRCYWLVHAQQAPHIVLLRCANTRAALSPD